MDKDRETNSEFIDWTSLSGVVGRINATAAANDHEGTPFDASEYLAAVEAGVVPYGAGTADGQCASPAQWGDLLERLGAMCKDNGFPLVLSLRTGLTKTILRGGNPAIVEELGLPMLRGQLAPAFAYTEGADPFSFRTFAEPVQGGYLLHGRKDFVTGSATADVVMVYAAQGAPGKDLGVFLLDLNSDGVTREACNLAGLRSAGICTLHLNRAFVPTRHVLAASDGISHVQRFLNERRLFLVCPLVGQMQSILDASIERIDKSVRYGAPVLSMQHVQAMLGRMYVLIQTSRASMHEALRRQESSDFCPLWDPVGSAAKAFIVESALELVQIAQRLLGGPGYTRAAEYERHMRDFCGFVPGGGSQETLMVDLGVHAISQAQRSAISQSEG